MAPAARMLAARHLGRSHCRPSSNAIRGSPPRVFLSTEVRPSRSTSRNTKPLSNPQFLVLNQTSRRFQSNESRQSHSQSTTETQPMHDVFDPFSREADSLQVIDRAFELHTLGQFGEFLTRDILPSGRKAGRQSPLLSMEDMPYLMIPSEQWAPEGAPKHSVPLMQEMMRAIGSQEDTSGLSNNTKPMQAARSWVWHGITPMSDAMWAENRLDDPANFYAATQHICQVTHVFGLLNLPDVRQRMQTAYNRIYDALGGFGQSLNAVLKDQNRDQVDLPAAWAEFFESQLTAMTGRAYSWVNRHIDTLWDQTIKTVKTHHFNPQLYPAPEPYDAIQYKLAIRLSELISLRARTEVLLWLPMEGFKGQKAPEPDKIKWTDPNMFSSDLGVRNSAFSRGMDLLSSNDPSNNMVRLHNTMLRHYNIDLSALSEEQRAGMDPINSIEITSIAGSEARAAKYLGEQLRGKDPAALGPPWWILQSDESLRHKPNGAVGYKIYRLTHDHTDEEWAEFVRRLEADIASWAEGDDHAAMIKDKWRLFWIDSKEEGLAADDVSAATEHFKTLRSHGRDENDPSPLPSVFLAVDNASFASYMAGDAYHQPPTSPSATSPPSSSPSDPYAYLSADAPMYSLSAPANMRFVHAVDADFDSADPDFRGFESPGFTGRMRILGSLLACDLYGVESTMAQRLEHMWPQARRMPGQVYQGAVVRAQEEAWGVGDRPPPPRAGDSRFPAVLAKDGGGRTSDGWPPNVKNIIDRYAKAKETGDWGDERIVEMIDKMEAEGKIPKIKRQEEKKEGRNSS